MATVTKTATCTRCLEDKPLCHGCNGGLGHFKDDPDRMLAAIEYLKRF